MVDDTDTDTYTLSPSVFSPDDQVVCTAWATDTNSGRSGDKSVAVTVGNSAPVITNVTVSLIVGPL